MFLSVTDAIWELVETFHDDHRALIYTILFLYPRYDSEGKYLGSLPDLATPRRFHSCTSFLTSNNEKVSTCCPIIFLLYFKQALLVAGGRNNGGFQISSTEIFLPSDGRWTSGGNLPRFSNHLNETLFALQLAS